MLLLQQPKPESKNVTSFTSQEIFMMLCAAVWRSRASSSSESAEMFFFQLRHPGRWWWHDWRNNGAIVGICSYNRRKFRSQTSDNMDRWKTEQGRGREKRKIRRKKSRRERVRRKKMQMREKVGKSRNTVFFPWFRAPEGRKVGRRKGLWTLS